MKKHKVFALMVCTWFSYNMVCGGTSSGCVKRSLVGANRLVIPDSSYTASSYYINSNIPNDIRYVPSQAKLNSDYGWAPQYNDKDDYLQIDLLDERIITSVATQGSGKTLAKEWVKSYKLKFKKNNTSNWEDYGKTIEIPTSYYYSNKVIDKDLAPVKKARYIRFVPQSFNNHKTMRVNVYIGNQEAPKLKEVTPNKRYILVKWTIKTCFSITGYIINVIHKETTQTKIFHYSKPQANNYNITGLQPFSTYAVQVKAVPDGFWSGTTKVKTQIAAPETKPGTVTLEALSSTSLRVNWTTPLDPKHLINGPLTGYRITYTPEGKPSQHVDVGMVNTWKLTSLEKYTQYIITVSVNNTQYVGPPSDKKTIKTLGDAPSVPVNVKSSLTEPKGFDGPQLLITSDLPREQNGEIRQLILRYFYNDTNNTIREEEVFPVDKPAKSFRLFVNITMTGTLVYQLSAYTLKEGPYKDGYAVIPAYPPWGSPSNVSAIFINTSTIAVSWDVIPANTLNSKVISYDVKLVHKYICKHTIKYQPDKTKEKIVTVPIDKRSIMFNDLLPCSKYHVLVRGNTEGGFGPYSNQFGISTQTDKSFLQKNKSSTSNVAVGLVIALIVVILIMAVLVILIRKHRTFFKDNFRVQLKIPRRNPAQILAPKEKKATFKRKTEDVCLVTSEEISYVNVDELTPLTYMMTFLKPDGSIDECELKKQFKNVPTTLQYENNQAVKTNNKTKNRYKNIVAYDRSRVILRAESNESEYMNTASIRNDQECDSDYINASYVQGYNGSPRTYIATQGPLPNTVVDFWRMIWDQNTTSIVMLTNLIEIGKRKCHQYWPERTDVYGDITVNSHQTQVFADYVIRTFYISKRDHPSRKVLQFHFTAWPDKGVPQHASAILAFRRKVLESNSVGTVGPTVVHCSAGVGRTGAYIMIDAMLQQGEEQNKLETFNYLQSIRGDRPYMVQTEDQYIFVHKAIYEELSCGNTEVAVQNLNVAVQDLSMVDEGSNKDGFTREFQRLNTVTSKYNSIDEGKRVILSHMEEEEEKYIDAAYVNTFREKDAYIVTQAPTDSTVGDIWRMVMQYDIGTIVMLNKLQEQNQIFHQYWPEDKQVLGCHGINVQQVKVDFLGEIVARTFQVINSKKSLEVVHLQHIGWDDKRTPDDKQSILNLLNEVEKSQQQGAGRSPVLVHCSNGLGRSGTFCAVASTLERVKQEQVLDVFQTVKSIRSSRPGAVETLDQYKFCYSIVKIYLDSFSEYDNFRGN